MRDATGQLADRFHFLRLTQGFDRTVADRQFALHAAFERVVQFAQRSRLLLRCGHVKDHPDQPITMPFAQHFAAPRNPPQGAVIVAGYAEYAIKIVGHDTAATVGQQLPLARSDHAVDRLYRQARCRIKSEQAAEFL